jgi:hypothetical protein
MRSGKEHLQLNCADDCQGPISLFFGPNFLRVLLPCSLRLVVGAVALLLLPVAGNAQSAAVSPKERTLLNAPPERRHVISTTLFHPLASGGLVANLRGEWRCLSQFSALAEGAFYQVTDNGFRGESYSSSATSLSVGVRYYLAVNALTGWYLEALAGGQRRRWQEDTLTGQQITLRPELAAGYHIFIGQKRRFVADLGARVFNNPRTQSDRRQDYSTINVFLLPTLRAGLAF